MEKYTCECCGATVNPYTLKCEYCGTQYKDEFNNLIRIQYCKEPIDTYKTRVSISNLNLEAMAEKSGEIILNELASRLTEVIKRNISISVRNDPLYNEQVFYGTIKVVRPIHDYNNIAKETT